MLQKLIPSVVCKRGRFISLILSLPCTSGCTCINDFKRPLLKAWQRLKQVLGLGSVVYVVEIELGNGSCSPWSLCGSEHWSSLVEHWSTESKGLGFHSSWGLCFVPCLWQDKNHLFPSFKYLIFKITFLLLIFCLAWMDSELSRLTWWWRILTSLSLAQVSDGKGLNILNFWMSRLICDIIIRLEIENNVLLSLWGPCGRKCLLELNFQSPFRKLHL